ncbi:hypothetical protein PV05_05820 [Exophiala xenobiotica]|uniref:Prokaryotic-type class I peptide chain release factors domain-containing protein n=1 Tax=Exophiala xenobiotica TaxID=348802 RepID=A0A0D2FB09_9EURO|nr:uncharacterized protein PV05_05820 [Exophiala xenobiotica]KIW57244.1 hypothetical protein PV05_05820 [Exophiala xenobiotica]
MLYLRPLRHLLSSSSLLRCRHKHYHAELQGAAGQRSPFPLAGRRPLFAHSARVSFFSTTAATGKKTEQLPPRPWLPDSELKHTFVKGSGPGGQKINKTNSAAQVTHLPTGIVVKCQATRSRSENFKIAKRILAEKVEFLAKGDESRAAKVEERARRKKASKDKKSRRKYKRLASEPDTDKDGDEDDPREEGDIGTGIQIDKNEHVELEEGQHLGKGNEVDGRSSGEEGARVDGQTKPDSSMPTS